MIRSLRFKIAGVFLWACLKVMPRSKARDMMLEAVEMFIANANDEFGLKLELKDSMK